MLYKNIDLSSNEINTVIFGGAGNKGFIFLGLIKLLQEHNILNTLKTYYGVSAGSIIVLLLNLGYTYDEMLHILLNELKYNELLQITSKSVLNLFDKFAISDSTYLEETIKSLIEKKGFNPYINFKQLHNITCKELNIGFVKCFQNKYINANYRTRPDMPIWLAVRASASIPFVYQPVIDATNGFDFLIDGGILNDNNIGLYLESIMTNPETKFITMLKEKATQVDFDLETYNIDNNDNKINDNKNNDIINVNDNINDNTDISSKEIKYKYHQNFICVNLDTGSNTELLYESITELNKVKFQDFIFSVAKKIFVNQAVNNPNYKKYILNIPCKLYNIDEINGNLSNDNMIYIINDCYKFCSKYYENTLKKI